MKLPSLRSYSAHFATRIETLLTSLAGPVAGFALLLFIWQIAALQTPLLPAPSSVLSTGMQLLASPFGNPGQANSGIGWAVLTTLARMSIALVLAMAVGLPLGFLLGRLDWLNAVLTPLINLFRHVSPLAWLPLGLLIFSGKSQAAVATVCVCCMWPMILHTAEGVRRVPADYLIVARTLALGEWKTLRAIVFPCALPAMISGIRQAASSAWVVVVAAEIFINEQGLGAWLRSALAEQNSRHVLLAIILVGMIGWTLDLPLLWLKRRITRTTA